MLPITLSCFTALANCRYRTLDAQCEGLTVHGCADLVSKQPRAGDLALAVASAVADA